MSIRILLILAVTALVSFALGVSAQNGPKVEKSPHAAALELVFKTQAARIYELEGQKPGSDAWWLDIKERAWVVRRPFYPGVLNTTNWFDVSYRIEGKEVATWFVHTARGEVKEVKK